MYCNDTLSFHKKYKTLVFSLPTHRNSKISFPMDFDSGGLWESLFRNFERPAITAAKSSGSEF
jgi:hypothetical protein